METKLESYLHECSALAEYHPRAQREWISKDLNEAT